MTTIEQLEKRVLALENRMDLTEDATAELQLDDANKLWEQAYGIVKKLIELGVFEDDKILKHFDERKPKS